MDTSVTTCAACGGTGFLCDGRSPCWLPGPEGLYPEHNRRSHAPCHCSGGPKSALKVGDPVAVVEGGGQGVRGTIVEIDPGFLTAGVKVSTGGVWWFHLAHLQRLKTKGGQA